MKMRPYQQQAHDDCIAWVRKNTAPCVLELPTGAGKSIIVAEIANSLNKVSKGKHVLCIVPSKELLEQNADKIIATGNAVSLFSASVGETCLANPLVVGTPVSIKNQLERFGSQFCAVIIDECHKITPTVIHIIDQLQVFNENLRIIGLSATPYRLSTGYIFKHDLRGVALHESKTRDPYFDRLIYKITARELIQQGYLCQPIVGAINSQHYETLNMQTNAMGNFSKDDIDKAYHGKGRLTAEIVADVIEQSRDRKGVLFFAATIQHAGEIMESLPPELSAIVTGGTPAREREIILLKFKAQILKYLVNVAVLTTGFDAPHCDVVAILRATESAALLQQIIGRGLRLSDGKQDCLVLDYAENIERHCPDGDVFNPDIKTSNSVEFNGEYLIARCPECGLLNETKPRDNDAGFGIDDNGYFVDLQGNRIETEYGFFPAHHSRSCQSDYCDYKWSFKPCHECGHENDVAARYCGGCKEELIDPNEKLVRQYRERKSDPYQMQTDDVIDMKVNPTISKAGNECLRVEFTTAWRTFTVFFTPVVKRDHDWFMSATKGGTQSPETITYQKVGDFYKIYNYNARVLNDEIPPVA
jgi:DNA repair protein RadD